MSAGTWVGVTGCRAPLKRRWNATTTTYSQAFPTVGQVASTVQKQGNGSLISATTATLASTAGTGTSTYTFPYRVI